MDPAAPPWLEGLDHLLSRWQAMIDLLARSAGMPYAMINRLAPDCLMVQTLNSGAEGFEPLQRIDLQANTYCSHVLRSGRPLRVEDARVLPEMHDNPSTLFGLVYYHGLPIREADGSLFGTICMLDFVPRQPDENTLQLIALLRDSIEQDLALLRANQALQASIAESCEARRAAEAANRAKTDFMARISHELRTPLGAVLGFAQLLEMDTAATLTTKQRERVAHIYQGGNHLLALLNDMLDVASVEAGQLHLQLQALDVAPLLAHGLTLSQAQAQAAGITLHPAEGAGRARADENRLRQVLLNLLSNAIKYGRTGGQVWTRIGARGEHLLIEVRDDGLGMNAEQLAHLFEPFNRLGRESSQVAGTGLGMALSRQLMQLMGGSIEVDSEVQRGSCVRLLLPSA